MRAGEENEAPVQSVDPSRVPRDRERPAVDLRRGNESVGKTVPGAAMSSVNHEPGSPVEIYKLHAELAEKAAVARENLNKLYSAMVSSIVTASVLLNRVAPDSATMWVLPVLGMIWYPCLG